MTPTTVALLLAVGAPCPVIRPVVRPAIRPPSTRPCVAVEHGPAWGRDPTAKPRFDGGQQPWSTASQSEAVRAGRERTEAIQAATGRWRPGLGLVQFKLD